MVVFQRRIALYEGQAIVWLKTLRYAACRSEPAVIHAFAPSRRLIVEAARHGAELVEVDYLHPTNGPPNKLTQLESPVLADADCVVMCDCDLAFCDDVSPALGAARVRAKLVDQANPSYERWCWLFAQAGFGDAPRLAQTTYDQYATYANNFNGGIYVLPRSAFLALRVVWPRWHTWVLERSVQLGPWARHADQISFGLASEELALDVSLLGPEMNFPSHLDYTGRAGADVPDPRVIHYHRLDERARLTQDRASERGCRDRARQRAAGHAGRRRCHSRDDPTLNRRPKIVVSSGWWCGYAPHAWQVGDPVTTSPPFFELWHRQVGKCIDPAEIVVTDSASPLKPPRHLRDAVRWIELDRNYGHGNDIRTGLSQTKYSGGSRSRILGCTYALCCDADIYVHVEQDCLLHGERIIDAALAGTTESVVIGAPTIDGRNALDPDQPAASFHQNSLMIIRREGLERFLTGLMAGPESDGQLPAEVKMARDCAPFDELAIPFGRSRPIDFSVSHFYAQHLTADELAEFCALEGVGAPRWREPNGRPLSSDRASG